MAKNLFKVWHKRGVEIDCWGIGFNGWGYRGVDTVKTIYPAGMGGEWHREDRMELFLHQLANGGYTHVWIMQDTFLLSATDFPIVLRRVCAEKGIRSMLYFPVDAPLDPAWTDIIAAVDAPVAYTAYGGNEARRAARARSEWLWEKKVETPLNYDFEPVVLPHGVDFSIYRPMAERKTFRHMLYAKKEWLLDDDFFMLNVNMNQCRKDPPRSLEILAGLRARGIPAKLALHMPESGGPEQQISLEQVANQLGLKTGCWGHHGMLFRNGQGILPEAGDPAVKESIGLVHFYNAADLYLTTTKGEGWGLGITEALACGLPVAVPYHTGCMDIMEKLCSPGVGYDDMVVLLDPEAGANVDRADNSRMRHRVDLAKAVEAIAKYYESGKWQNRQSLAENKELKEWLSWDRIGWEMLRLLKTPPLPAKPIPEKPTEAKGCDVQFGGVEKCGSPN